MGEGAIDFEEKITTPKALVDITKALYPEKESLYLSVDEWGAFGGDIRSVLANAMCLNSFIRHAGFVKMANFTMMTSLLATDQEKGTYKSPLFNAFKLFSDNCRGKSLDTYVQCDTYDTDKFKDIPYLDVTTVYSESTKTVYVNVINRHRDKSITTEISGSAEEQFTGKARISSIEGDPAEIFSYDKKDQYAPVVKEAGINNNRLTYTFPPHSLTQIALTIK